MWHSILIFRSGKSQPAISQYSVIIKAILADLQERREDCDKLREKIDRLEVQYSVAIYTDEI